MLCVGFEYRPTRGVLQNLSGVHLVILGDLLPISDVSEEILHSALDKSGIQVVTQDNFVIDPAEWLGRTRDRKSVV